MRTAIYCRVSTIDQAKEGTSLGTQEDACRADAAAHSDTVSEAHVYRETFTGTELWDRPKLTELRRAIRAGEVEGVVCHAIDRLARDPVHLGVILSEAEHAGVTVRFVTEPLDESPEGQLIRFVPASFAATRRRSSMRNSGNARSGAFAPASTAASAWSARSPPTGTSGSSGMGGRITWSRISKRPGSCADSSPRRRRDHRCGKSRRACVPMGFPARRGSRPGRRRASGRC